MPREEHTYSNSDRRLLRGWRKRGRQAAPMPDIDPRHEVLGLDDSWIGPRSIGVIAGQQHLDPVDIEVVHGDPDDLRLPYVTISSWAEEPPADLADIVHRRRFFSDQEMTLLDAGSPSACTMRIESETFTGLMWGDTDAWVVVTAGAGHCAFLSGARGSPEDLHLVARTAADYLEETR
jgi:hypothetical protein